MGLFGGVSVTWRCNDTVWPLRLIGLEARCCSWELSSNFNGLLGSETQADEQIRSHWMSSKRLACAPGLLWKSWLTVKSWTSATLLCSTWSWWRETLQIPAKSTHFICCGWIRLSTRLYLLSAWTLDCDATRKTFKGRYLNLTLSYFRNGSEKLRISAPFPAEMLPPARYDVSRVL